MLDKLKKMFVEELEKIEAPELHESNVALSGLQEEEVEEVLNIFRATRLPMKTYYYDRARKQYVIISHVFHKKDMAESFMHDLKEALPSAKISLKEDSDGRNFVCLLPRTLDENELAHLMVTYKAKLFHTSDNFFDPKSKVQAKIIVDSLRTTSVPMDLYYWNFENNRYYISSHVFHDYRRVERYRDRFEEHFGKYAIDVVEDVAGRFILHLNPKAIEKKKFDKFVNDYRIGLFEELPNHNQSQGDDFFEGALDQCMYILNTLRGTKYPFDNVFYDKKYDTHYVVSYVFYNEERAVKYMNVFKDNFKEFCIIGRSDEEGRWFLFLNPNFIKKSKFKEFCKMFAVNVE